MLTWKRNERAYRSLVICFLFSLLALVPHIVKPVPTTLVYGSLIVVLIVVNVAALRLFDKAPCVAVQIYWWIALFVVSAMTAIDAQNKLSDPPLPPPFIVAIPPLATVLIRMFVSWRASLVYGIGTLALVIPAGMVYQEFGQSIALVGIVILAVTIGGRKRNDTSGLREATKLLNVENEKLANAYRRHQERRE